MIGTMSEVFEGYERQYCKTSASLSRISTSTGVLDGGKLYRRLFLFTLLVILVCLILHDVLL